MPKNPNILDKVILRNGGVIEREDGTDIISVSADGATTNITGTETVVASEIVLANGKFLVGNGSGVGAAQTVAVNFTGSALATHGHTFTGDALATHTHDLQQISAEALTVTAGTGVSSAAVGIPIAMVESVYVTAGGVTGAATVIPAGQTPATKECTYNPTTGVFQFLIADAVTAAVITYVQRVSSATSGGTPAGTNSLTSGGTPAGTNAIALS